MYVSYSKLHENCFKSFKKLIIEPLNFSNFNTASSNSKNVELIINSKDSMKKIWKDDQLGGRKPYLIALQ